MRYLIAVGISAGVIAGIFVHLSLVAAILPVIAWVSFAGEASFFAAGGKNDGFLKSLIANISGVFWGYIILLLSSHMQIALSLGIAVCIITFMMCIQANIKILSFIPGTFIGTACLFVTISIDFPMGNILGIVIALALGASMGWLAEKGAGLICNLITKKTREVGAETEIV